MKNRIAELRNELGFSVAELAKKLNMNISTIQKYESGKINPPTEKLIKIASLFNCSVDYIIGISDDKNEELKKSSLNTLIEIRPETKKIFIERIKTMIVEKEITKSMLANEVEIEIEKINQYINGEDFPDIDNLKKMAIALNTTVDYLVGINDNSSQDEIVLLETSIIIDKNEDYENISPNMIRDFLKSLNKDNEI